MGPARARSRKKGGKKPVNPDASSDSASEFILPSEFEENDDDLAHYLQSNTSFLMNMNATGAFTVP